MSHEVIQITDEQAVDLLSKSEGQFLDFKGQAIGATKLSKHISAFANSDGGDLYIGIWEEYSPKRMVWNGFATPEDANSLLGVFERIFPLGTNFQYEFLKCSRWPTLVLHVLVNKTEGIIKANDGHPYVRRGAQSLVVNTPEMLRNLEFLKGTASFESESVNAPLETIVDSPVLADFLKHVIPTASPEPWLKKQIFIRHDKPSVAGVLLFAEEPQAYLPKRSGIKIHRYKTKDELGSRQTMAFTPETIEGCLYAQIKRAVERTTEIIEGIPKLGDNSLETISYPNETLHEIITNAVIHRDYSIADDVHIRIFDNRIEVQSPGRLPAHITPENILRERAARNGAIVRILNKFPDPPNKDVGEGLNTAFAAMHQLGLKEPSISQTDSAVIVSIRHEPLASPEDAIMHYLESHNTINNSKAREITHITADHRVKGIFKRMETKGMIEQVPGTRTSNTAYRKTLGREQSDDTPDFWS